jgi:hypothetical protein
MTSPLPIRPEVIKVVSSYIEGGIGWDTAELAEAVIAEFCRVEGLTPRTAPRLKPER